MLKIIKTEREREGRGSKYINKKNQKNHSNGYFFFNRKAPTHLKENMKLK